jgi:two-component sensor histidine kinase
VPVLEYSHDDPDVVAFIEEATRYYQIYDADHGTLLVQSTSFQSLGLHYTPGEVALFRQGPQVHDVQTDRGRFRILSSLVVGTGADTYLLQVGESLSGVDRALARFDRLLVWGHWREHRRGRVRRPVDGRTRADAASRASPGRRARSTSPTCPIACPCAAPTTSSTRWRWPSIRRSPASSTPWERCGSSVRRWRTSCARRSPSCVGKTELALNRQGLPAELRARLESQLDEFDRLTRLINQILTLARAEGGEIVLARVAIDLVALAQTVVEQLQPVAEASQVALHCDAGEPVSVTGDAGWLERLLLILLDNAIKFTPAGGHVTVQLAREPSRATLAVRDTGVGIDAEAMPHVFERFYRADPARSREDAAGAGLGLALAKWIVDRHGGTIDVTSRPGTGSTFTVHLPANA